MHDFTILDIEYMYIPTYEFVHMLQYILDLRFARSLKMTPAHLQCSTIEITKLEK